MSRDPCIYGKAIEMGEEELICLSDKTEECIPV